MLLAAFFLNQLLFCCLTLFLKLYTQSLPFSYTTHRKSVTCQTTSLSPLHVFKWYHWSTIPQHSNFCSFLPLCYALFSSFKLINILVSFQFSVIIKIFMLFTHQCFIYRSMLCLLLFSIQAVILRTIDLSFTHQFRMSVTWSHVQIHTCISQISLI